MLIMPFGCLRFLRESCLLYAFLLGYLPSIFLRFFYGNLLTFICRTPILLSVYAFSLRMIPQTSFAVNISSSYIANDFFRIKSSGESLALSPPHHFLFRSISVDCSCICPLFCFSRAICLIRNLSRTDSRPLIMRGLGRLLAQPSIIL